MQNLEHDEVTARIFELCQDPSLDFQARVKQIQGELTICTTTELLDHLNHAGVIPECFIHDSTEEKLFAKYCDALLARALCEMGLNARVIEERADAVDSMRRLGSLISFCKARQGSLKMQHLVVN
jgi:hypothetical protein